MLFTGCEVPRAASETSGKYFFSTDQPKRCCDFQLSVELRKFVRKVLLFENNVCDVILYMFLGELTMLSSKILSSSHATINIETYFVSCNSFYL
jgi:hypothetical protein